jgi:signal transduction histidine kinase/CheY-like chemotaxis protein
VTPDDQISETNRLLVLAESLAGFGYWRLDFADGSLVWSRQMYLLTGFPEDRVPTQDWVAERYHPDDRVGVLSALDHARETGELAEIRFRWRLPDGTYTHIAMSGRSDGADTLLGVARDVGAEVTRERELIAARDQARSAERAKADFLAVMTHEIRTPMTGMLGTIDLLRDDPVDMQRVRLLENLSQSTCTLMSVLDDVLDYSRVEAGRIVLDARDFDLKGLVRNTIDLFQSSATMKAVRLDASGLDGDPATVRGDASRVQQIVSNLVGNAIKTTEGGTISITLSPSRSTSDADYWMVVVRDNGTGIGQDTLGRIFSRFEQADASLARVQGGSPSGLGLGLAISRQLAEAMGGSIAVSSETGQGSICSVEIPFARQLAPQVPVAVNGDGRPSGPLRILLAEDNPINRRLMSALLVRQGHDVVAVEDGRKAISAMTSQPFDLVLMDMQMPELDGLGATRAIRALDPPASETPILAISADAMPERRRQYFEAGIDNFLPKPIVSSQLIEMIDKMRRSAVLQTESLADRFNRERLSWLVEQAGYEDAAVLMKMLLFDVVDRPQRIAAAIRATAWELASAEADALRTLLDSFGQFALSRLLASIARQCGQQACPSAMVDELHDQAAALAIYLRTELGGIPTPIAKAIDNVVEPEFVAKSLG